MSEEEMIDNAVLEALNAAGSFPMRKSSLVGFVRMKVAPKPLVSAVESRIDKLDSDGLIEGINERYELTFTLTSAGKHFWKQYGA